MFFITQLKTEAQFCFNAQTSNPNLTIAANAFCSSDFNTDGKIDFAIANGGGVKLLLQQGSNNFDVVTQLDTNSFANLICTADLNYDNKADIITYNYGPGDFSFYLGNGDGTFATPITLGTGLFNANGAISAADYNNDGKIDLTICNSNFNVRMYPGNGDGTFGTYITTTTNASVSKQLLSVDLNADGNLDLVTPSLVLLGDGSGSFPNTVNLVGGYLPQFVSIDDFNNDSKLDIVVNNWGTSANTAGFTGNISMFLGDGLGGFASPIYSSIGDSLVSPNYKANIIGNADFDGDGKLDIAIATYHSNAQNSINTSNIEVLKGDGLGSFSLPQYFNIGRTTNTMMVTDMNGDSKSDIVAITKRTDTTDISRLTILYNCGFTSINETHSEAVNISLVPNPSNGIVSISSQYAIDEIKLVDMLGNIISTSKPNEINYQLNIEKEGFYLISVTSNHQTENYKLINK